VSPEALDMAAGMRTLIMIVTSATIVAHIGLIGFHWFKLGAREV